MKIAVFTDIHGNLNALKTVLVQIKEQKVDLTVFLGDIFQRGNEEIQCLQLLKSTEIICLKGNCELYLAHGVDIDPDVEYLREYYDEMRKKLSDEQLQFIKQMPLYYETEEHGHKIRFSHFLFSDLNTAYPFLPLSSIKNGVFEKACESVTVKQYDMVVIGHSHQNFENGNVVSVSASGLDGASFLLIDVTKEHIRFERILVDPRL